MSKVRYVRVVERALREAVIPAIDDAIVSDTLASCMSVLAVLGEALDAEARSSMPPSPPENLPPALRQAIAATAGAALPEGLPDDPAIGADTIDTIVAGKAWIDGSPEPDVPSLQVIETLLDWERAQRESRLAAIARATEPAAAIEGGVGDLDGPPLEAYIKSRYGDAARLVAFRRVMGGRSRQTALFSQEGIANWPRDLVIQRDSPTAHSPGVAFQAPVLEKVCSAGVLAPRPYLLELSRVPLGAPFMIVGRLPGRPAINPTTDYFKPPPPGMERVALDMAEQLARLHTLPAGPFAETLSTTFDRKAGNGWRGEIARLRSTLEAQARGPSMLLSAGIGWLERHAGEIGETWGLVHNDVLLHNLLIDQGRVTGVLDWELVHIGHPGEDLGYARPVIEQIMPWRDFMAAYAAAGGASLDETEVDFFALYTGIRLFTQLQVPRNLVEAGVTDDLRLAEAGAAFNAQLLGRVDRMVRAALAAERSGVAHG